MKGASARPRSGSLARCGPCHDAGRLVLGPAGVPVSPMSAGARRLIAADREAASREAS